MLDSRRQSAVSVVIGVIYSKVYNDLDFTIIAPLRLKALNLKDVVNRLGIKDFVKEGIQLCKGLYSINLRGDIF
jgi:hypothetical protein